MKASIVVTNYNYGRFLGEAIDSALAQSYRETEVIVVDDGSTDDSREILAGYGDAVVSLFRENRGQTSAMNAGFAASSGDAVLFLDADDTLRATAVEQAMRALDDTSVAHVHWPLTVVDAAGEPTGDVQPRGAVARGDLLEAVIRDGPDAFKVVPTSGNVWARRFLARVMPLAEIEKTFSVGSANTDSYLAMLAPLFGTVAAIDSELGTYRLHGSNDYGLSTPESKLARNLWSFDDRCRLLAEHCDARGITVDVDDWKRRSWVHRVPILRDELSAVLPPGTSFVFVDQQHLAPAVPAGRTAIPFLQRDGEYWGNPADDETAIRELTVLQQRGASFLVIGWPAFWWLDHYRLFTKRMRDDFQCVLDNERALVFALNLAERSAA
jgi:glycosyltransferase involved in cell wall biosynthesis